MGRPRRLKFPAYPKELMRPLVAAEPQVSGLSVSEAYLSARKRDREALYGRLVLLAQHHEAIDEGEVNWFMLAFRLAQAHVPGMTITVHEPRGPGRPKSTEDPFELYRAVFAILESSADGCFVIQACRILSKRKGTWKGKNAKVLANKFHKTKALLTSQGARTSRLGYPWPPLRDPPLGLTLDEVKKLEETRRQRHQISAPD